MEQVILVDAADVEIGTSEKLRAHQDPGQLHRALSVFLFDSSGKLLLQQRAAGKHHFSMLWSNTCCTHPRPREGVLQAGRRRLEEEMGVTAALREVGVFTYRAVDSASELVEHEIDHVLVGAFTGDAEPDTSEVLAWRWVEPASLRSQLQTEPERYTPWLSEALAIATGQPTT